MALIINSIEGERIYDLDTFESMLSDDYLSDKTNLQTKFIFDKFFKHDAASQDDHLKLLNISFSIPSLITDKFSDYVGQPNMPLKLDLEDFVSAFIWGGSAIFKPAIVNDEFEVLSTPPDEYILEADGTQRTFAALVVFTDNGGILLSDASRSNYLFEQTYTTDGFLENRLYKITKGQSRNSFSVIGEQVPLSTIPATEDLPDSENLRFEKSPLVVVNNKKIKYRKYGESEIRRVRSIISSIEIELVNIQDQFLKHLQSKLAIPASRLKTDEDGQVDIKNLEVIAMEAGDTLPAYIMNTNPLIEQSFKYIEGFLRQICAVLSIPTDFLGITDAGGAETAEAKRIRLTSFIKKIEKIRSKFEVGLRAVEEVRESWFGKMKSGEDFTISWPALFPETPKEQVEQLTKAQDAKLISNKKAIMQYQDLTMEEAEAEQEDIAAEAKTAEPEPEPKVVEVPVV